MENYESRHYYKNSSFVVSSYDEQFLFQVVDLFPIPIEIFRPDGMSLFVNGAFLECFHIPDPAMIVGKLNIREDSYLLQKMGLSQYMDCIFCGEVRSLHDIRVPSNEIVNRYHSSRGKPGTDDMYQDITCFPLKDEQGAVQYVIAVFLTKQVYKEQQDVLKAKEYVRTHWREEFDIDQIADAAGFSRHHFARLFRKYTGMTPYSYYQDVIVNELKAALDNKEYTVSQAFMSCSVDYNGSFAKIFKERTGMTPSQYKNRLSDQESHHKSSPKIAMEQAQDSCHSHILNNLEQVMQVFEMFPFPIKIFDMTGNVIFVNRMILEMWNISEPSQIVGKYNLKTDHVVNEKLGLTEYVARTFAGETVLVPDVKVPLADFSLWYAARSEAYNIESMYTDILNFPITENNQIRYIVTIFLTTRIYQGKADIAKAIEFIENNWKDNLDIDKIASVSGFSRYHFVRLFKKHTGMAPYSYYQQLKIQKLKEALRDKNRTVSEAFTSCGMAYHGSWASLFREKVGMTPSEYRKSILQ